MIDREPLPREINQNRVGRTLGELKDAAEAAGMPEIESSDYPKSVDIDRPFIQTDSYHAKDQDDLRKTIDLYKQKYNTYNDPNNLDNQVTEEGMFVAEELEPEPEEVTKKFENLQKYFK